MTETDSSVKCDDGIREIGRESLVRKNFCFCTKRYFKVWRCSPVCDGVLFTVKTLITVTRDGDLTDVTTEFADD